MPQEAAMVSAEQIPLPTSNIPSDVEEELNYEHIALSMQTTHNHQHQKKKTLQQKSKICRHARHLGIPSPHSGLAKSIVDWTKSMILMDLKNNKLPQPPTEAEKQYMVELTQNKKAAVQAQITTQVPESSKLSKNSTLQSIEVNLLEKQAFKSISTAKNLGPAFSKSIHLQVSNHDETWVQHGHALIANSGIPRPTYDWEDNVTSKWNSAMTGIILYTWEIAHQRGGTSKYSIDETQNTHGNCLAILNRWISNCKAVWRQENHTKPASDKGPKKQINSKKMIKIKVSFPDSTMYNSLNID